MTFSTRGIDIRNSFPSSDHFKDQGFVGELRSRLKARWYQRPEGIWSKYTIPRPIATVTALTPRLSKTTVPINVVADSSVEVNDSGQVSRYGSGQPPMFHPCKQSARQWWTGHNRRRLGIFAWMLCLQN